MQLKLLGSAAYEGIPALFCACDVCRRAWERGGKDIRKRTSALLNEKYLIDFSPDIYPLYLEYRLPLNAMEHIFITHSHSDHFNYQDLMARADWYSHNHQSTRLTIYGNADVVRIGKSVLAREILESGRICYTERAPFIPFTVDELTVTPLLAQHMQGEQAYLYLFEEDGKTLFYGLDSGYYPAPTWEALAGRHIHTAVMDCTYGKNKNDHGHCGFENVLELCARMREIGAMDEHTQVVVNHFSHNGGVNHADLEAMAAPYGIRVGYDGMVLEIL